MPRAFGVEPVSDREHPLIVVLQLAAIERETSLNEQEPAQRGINRCGKESGALIPGKGRGKRLIAPQYVQAELRPEIPRESHGAIGPGAERTVETGIMYVGAKVQQRNMPEGNAIHLIEGTRRISAAVAAAQFGVNRNLLYQFDASPAAKSLEQVFVQQSRE